MRQNGIVKLRKKATKDGGFSLYLEYSSGGARSYDFLHLYLVPERNTVDRMRNKETLRTAEAVKAQKVIELQNTAHGLSNVRLKQKKPLADYIAEIRNANKDAGKYNKGGLLILQRQVQSYSKDIAVQDIGRNFLLDFIKHLTTYKTQYGKKAKESTVAITARCLRTVLNKAIRDELIPQNPFATIDASELPREKAGDRAYLTAEEVGTLARTDSGEKGTDVKAAFLFCCFTALRYSDVKALKWRDIRTAENGAKQIEIRQQKTAEPVVVPLSENALKWLPKRKRADKDTANIYRLPTDAVTNRRLRKWVARTDITKAVTFHVARHTAATLLLSYGADIYTVSKLLGHTSVKTTEIYAKVVDAKRRAAVNLIPEI